MGKKFWSSRKSCVSCAYNHGSSQSSGPIFFYISFSFCPDIIPSKIDMKWYFNIFWVDVLSSFCVTFMNFDDISCILTCYFQTLITLRCNDPVTSNYLQSKGQDLGYNCDHTSSERLEVIFGVKLTPKVDPLFKYWIKKS